MTANKTPKTVLVLRACNNDMSSRDGFVWPSSGPVEAPDWEPTKECGNGLHGWLHGHGDGSVSDYWEDDSKWLVVKVETKHMIELKGKVKFKKGTVVFCGDQKGATDYILANDPIASILPVIGAFIITGNKCAAVSGYKGTSTSGHGGTSTSGYGGTSTSGDGGKSISGDGGKSTSGDHGISTSGDRGTSISGDYGKSHSSECGISNSGHYGTSISGYGGTSTSGYGGTSTSGDHGTSTSGNNGTSTTGYWGTIIIKYWKDGRYYSKVGHIGEDGLEPNVAYKLDDNHNFIKA